MNQFIKIMIITFSICNLVFASSGGFTGRTLKNSTLGCGSCHGNNPVPEVMVNIIGPDTVNVNQATMFYLTITKLSKTGAGLDISTSQGTLNPFSNNIHLSNGELTQNNNIPMTNGTVTISFTYTAPNQTDLDTIWAIGIATNSDGFATGDNWNWGQSKRIIIRNISGIKQISEEKPDRFKLEQNYPNPFNPSTEIKFSIYAQSYVKLLIYNILGKVINSPVNGVLKAGNYKYKWEASDYSSGTYFYRLETLQFTETKRMILIK